MKDKAIYIIQNIENLNIKYKDMDLSDLIDFVNKYKLYVQTFGLSDDENENKN